MSTGGGSTPLFLRWKLKRALTNSYKPFFDLWQLRMQKLPHNEALTNRLQHYHPQIIYWHDLQSMVDNIIAKNVPRLEDVQAAMMQEVEALATRWEGDMEEAKRMRLAEIRCAIDCWASALGISQQMNLAMRSAIKPGQSLHFHK